ncbi:MAG: cob(I)yrinic acid a,c-diamide adenosyltransferase [Prevotellaceae bacterium]|jgi:cob(I)alamin adenosyltransferase|nr:cob(I)yrinic acid a,c-diamide adenosyltransferase [Prevotellaceae bacterium]
MKIYTKTGDKGTTSLVSGKRVSKAHPRVEAYGTVDELISYIGVVRSSEIDPQYKDILHKVQNRLMICAALLANDGMNDKLPVINEKDITLLEHEIDTMESLLPQLEYFILPGGNQVSSFCHVARSICRRAERCAIGLTEKFEIPEIVIQYLNRLSDYLFVLARKLAKDLNADEIYWIPEK